MRFLLLMFVSLFTFLLTACHHQASSQKNEHKYITTHAKEGVLAPKPLYRDPVFDGAADPSIIYDTAQQKWLMFYTNRRANQPNLSHVSWVHGTPIAIAESVDGANWHYKGVVDFPPEIPHTMDKSQATYWAPAVIKHESTYHMYLTIVPGVFDDWNHPRTIVHLTSKDLNTWSYQSTLPLATNKVIDATVLQLPNGHWRLWYNNERDHKKTWYADSPDLYHWTDQGSAQLPQDRGEAPRVFQWKNHYWLLNDLLGNNGIGVYRSSDATTWIRQSRNLLDEPGTGEDDQHAGHHPDVIISDDRAYLYYFVHPGIGDDKTTEDLKRSSIQVVELHVVNGELIADRNQPTFVKLLPDVSPKQ